jgi:hypothetical protein
MKIRSFLLASAVFPFAISSPALAFQLNSDQGAWVIAQADACPPELRLTLS